MTQELFVFVLYWIVGVLIVSLMLLAVLVFVASREPKKHSKKLDNEPN